MNIAVNNFLIFLMAGLFLIGALILFIVRMMRNSSAMREIKTITAGLSDGRKTFAEVALELNLPIAQVKVSNRVHDIFVLKTMDKKDFENKYFIDSVFSSGPDILMIGHIKDAELIPIRYETASVKRVYSIFLLVKLNRENQSVDFYSTLPEDGSHKFFLARFCDSMGALVDSSSA